MENGGNHRIYDMTAQETHLTQARERARKREDRECISLETLLWAYNLYKNIDQKTILL
jgi:hypothetical protein